MATSNKHLQDLTVVHRLCFAARSLLIGAPHYWEIVQNFGIQGKEGYSLSAEECRVFIENLKLLQEGVFDTDEKLIKELVRVPKSDSSKPDRIGFILLSPNQNCILCKSKLYIRVDRSVLAVIYDEELGTLLAVHYTRYCRKSGCSFQQHYGYYTQGSAESVIYNDDALELTYFMSTRETGFTMKLLRRFDSQCLIGQISYKQAADIYNHCNAYENSENPESQDKTNNQ